MNQNAFKWILRSTKSEVRSRIVFSKMLGQLIRFECYGLGLGLFRVKLHLIVHSGEENPVTGRLGLRLGY